MSKVLIEALSPEVFKQMQDLLKSINLSTEAIIKFNATAKEVKVPSDLKKRFSETNSEIKKSNKTVSDAVKLSNKLSQSQVNQFNALTNTGKALAKSRFETTKLARTNRQLAEISSRLTGAFRKEEIRLAKLVEKYQNVAIVQGKSSKSAQKLQRQITKLDTKLKSVAASAGRFQKNVGNYPKQLRAAASAARGLASALGAVGGAFLVVGLARNVFNVFKDFNQSQADLAAILGVSQNEMSELTEQAKTLGATTAFTATQVAKLQLELSKLGFNKQEVLDAALGIENLAIATGVDAARAAKLGGAALKGFGLDASEANRVAAALAVSTTKSASSFETLETALPKVSAIAKSFGFTIEDTTALLGSLQNAGFEASVAGTSLRQIFLQLADSNGKLAQRLGGGASSLDELVGQFKKLESEGISLGEAFNLTNARSVAAFKVFLSGADDIKTLRDSIVDVEDELDILAAEKLNSVEGELKLLNSAWEGWILNLDESGEAADSLKSVLSFMSENLGNVLNKIVTLVKIFIGYKAVVIASALASRLFAAALIQKRIALIAVSGGLRGATRAMKLFSASLKTNPIGLFVGVLATVVTTFILFSKSAKEATKAIKENSESTIKQSKASNELIDVTGELISKYESFGKNAKLNTEQQKELDKVIIALAKNVPITALEFDKYGKVIGVNTEKVKAFSDELEKQTKLNNAAAIEKETRLLAKQEGVRKRLVSAIEKGTRVEIEGIGTVVKSDGVFKQVAKGRTDRIDELTLAQQAEVQNFIVGNLREIEATRDRIKALKGLKTSVEQIAEVEKKAKIAADENTLTIPQLRAEIKALENGINALTSKGYENLNKVQTDSILADRKSIKEKKAQIDAILGINKGTKGTIEAIAGSIAAFQKQISKLKELRDTTALTTEQYDDFTDKIRALEFQVSLLDGTYEDFLTKLDEPIETPDLKDLFNPQERVNFFEGDIDADLELEAELERLDRLKEANKEFFETKKELYRELQDLAINSINSIFEAELNRYDESIDENRDYYDSLLDNENLTEKQREALEDKREDRERELERKKKETEKKAFLFGQAFALGEIAIDTAKSVAKLKAQAAILAANPITAPLASIALSQIPFVIGTGAAAAASVVATSVPQFKDGVRNFEGGTAMLNDQKGSLFQEVWRTPDGGLHTTRQRNAIVDLPKGTDVFTAKESKEKFTLDSLLYQNGINYFGDAIQPINVNMLRDQNSIAKSTDLEVLSLLKTISNKKMYSTPPSAQEIGRQTAKAFAIENRVSKR